MIRIGLLGAAKIAPHAIISPASSRDDCTITCIASRNEQKGKAFAREHNIVNVETDYEALIKRDDIDLVYNALPPSHHCDLSIMALRTGKAVLCEKPFALNAAQARQMVAASVESGRPLLEAFHYRHHPAFIRFLEIVQSQKVGNVISIGASFNYPIPYREGELRHIPQLGGGALMDMGCYPVHWVRTIVGAEPVTVTGHCETVRPDIDISTSASLVFANGVTAKISSSMAADQVFHSDITVKGDKGTAHIMNPLHPSMGHLITITTAEQSKTETQAGKTTFDHQLDHVIDVLLGKTRPLTGGPDAIANMTLIDRIYESASLR